MIKTLTNEKYLPFAAALVSGAEFSVKIATFKAEVSEKPLAVNLSNYIYSVIKKKQDGIDVKFVMQYFYNLRDTPRSNIQFSKLLSRSGIAVRHLCSRCVHAKILIVDDKICIVGSHNLSVRSMSSNVEISVATDDALVVQEMCIFYDHLFDMSKAI